MSDDLHIQLYRPTDSKTGKKRPFQCQWVDPVTGKKRTKSAGTTIRREAEKFRAKLATEIETNGLLMERITWDAFRDQFELHGVSGKSKATQVELSGTLNRLEELIAPVRPEAIDSRVVSLFASRIRSQGRSDHQETPRESPRHAEVGERPGLRQNGPEVFNATCHWDEGPTDHVGGV